MSKRFLAAGAAAGALALLVSPKPVDAAKAGWEKIGSVNTATGAPFWCGTGASSTAGNPANYYQGDNQAGDRYYDYNAARSSWLIQGTSQFVYNVTQWGAYDPYGPSMPSHSTPWGLTRGDATYAAHYSSSPLPSASAWTYSVLRDSVPLSIVEDFSSLELGESYTKNDLAPNSEIPKLQITDGTISERNGAPYVDARTGSNQFRAVIVDQDASTGKRVRYRSYTVKAEVKVVALGDGSAQTGFTNGSSLEQVVLWAGYNTSFDLYAASLRFEKVASNEFVPHAVIKRKICGHYDAGTLVQLTHLAPWTPGKEYELKLKLDGTSISFWAREVGSVSWGSPVTRTLASMGTAHYAKDTGGNYLASGVLLPGTGGIRADEAELELGRLEMYTEP